MKKIHNLFFGFIFVFLGAIIVIFALYVLILIGLTALFIYSLCFFIKSLINFLNIIKIKSTSKKCPYCDNDNIKFRPLLIPEKTSDDLTIYEECICSDCGHTFNFIDKNEVSKVKTNAITKLVISIICVIFSCFLLFSFLIQNDSNKDDETTLNTENSTIWSKEYTNIEDFDYYIDGNYIYLKNYKGNSDKIKINNSYNINGIQYIVNSELGEDFRFNNVYSVIFPEGITKIPNNIFRRGIKYVYLPSTLSNESDSPFYFYFYELEIIYYGGTEEQWLNLTKNVDRTKIDAKQILYNIDVNELK